MGVERAITRWYIQYQTIQRDIDALQVLLGEFQLEEEPTPERTELEQQLRTKRISMLKLGPCPKPTMG